MTLFRAVLERDAREQDFDWSGLFAGPVHVVALQATHESIIRGPQVDEIARSINSAIARTANERRT
jgi:thioesterase domain-containing protein